MQSAREHMDFLNEVVGLGQAKAKYVFLKKSV